MNTIRTLAVLGCLACLPVSGTVKAAVTSDIITAQPTANGTVDFTIKDTNAGFLVKVSALGILATDTPAQKAVKLDAAAKAAIAAAGKPESDLFSSAVAGNTVTITKLGGGGMAVNVTADTTGEGNNLKTKEGGGNGEHWFWRAVRWLVASADPIVPSGNTYTLTTTNGASASVTGDGVATASELQDEITAQLALQGISFTPGVDPLTQQPFLVSQYFPVGAAFPPNGVGLETSPGFGDFLGGVGVELLQIPEPGSLALLGLALGSLVASRRKRVESK